ncbi:transcription-repair coupling factor [Granulosicoccaceae sp. 1_MG-2023]|nr:transcription-repair coupling factor [Granulosicoccaceae sp. 1_MG-2023]
MLQNTASLLPLPDEHIRHWGRLYGSAPALAISEYAKQSDTLVTVLVPAMHELVQLEAELRFYGGEALEVQTFIDWETLPYDLISPHQDIISERIRSLYRLPRTKRGVLLVSAAGFLQRLSPRSYLEQHALMIRNGDKLDPELFREQLVDGGYRNVAQVESHGEFAVRGSIIDLFPMASDAPIRLDVFDDELESIREFDPETQLSTGTRDSIDLLPAHEFPLNSDGIKRFRSQFRTRFESSGKDVPLYQSVSDGFAPGGIQYYTPLFFDAMATLFDYLPADCRFIATDGAETALHQFWESVANRYEERRHDIERPILSPEELYSAPDEMLAALEQRGLIRMQDFKFDESREDGDCVNFDFTAPGQYPVNARAEKPMQLLQGFLDSFDGRTLLVAESAGHREMLLDQLHGNRIRPAMVDSWQAFLAGHKPVALTSAPIDRGLQLREPALAVICESQLGGGRIRQRQRRRTTRDADAIIANLTDLKIGDPVVHIDHGVGRYQGLTTLDIGGVKTEFLTITYHGDDKLYVPVSALHLISRYTGAGEEAAPLHRLGSEQWAKARRKAAEKARDVAAELLEIHAKRAARQGYAYPGDSSDYDAFADAFPFEETPDQLDAINAVVADMRADTPMDRVVCGDVGFGKTEVAMRAAFVAADAGKQVVVLVPTTLLAEQHFQNFRDRFADWPIRIESLSRFRSGKEQKAVIDDLASGKVDIVIGTHKLIQKGIKYKNLGLVVIDEEHRFGVRHKEHMKALRSEVDILTLTATPIPRTLNMSLSGLRDLSIIATPPAHRHAIKTFVGEWSDVQIREACERELARGGQVYFLHNEVKSIEKISRQLEEIVPNARVRFAHGQMPESELESVMLDFYHQRFNILVATTIIESGIDVPSANTIIINRADKLGLAQLHQLRGRVGRSHHRAYAYLVAPPKGLLTGDAEKRLAAIESLEDLGVGFTLATHDLEIRGAGELLGEGQSGQIQEIGFTLYSQLLERAVEALKSGKMPELDAPMDETTEVELSLPALLPDDYVPDVHTRLILYKRIASAKDSEQIRELKVELIDRFGLLPDAAKTLFDITECKLRCAGLGVKRIEANAAGGRMVFTDSPAIDTMALLTMIQKEPQTYKFDGKTTLRFAAATETAQERLAFIDAMLQRLATNEAGS